MSPRKFFYRSSLYLFTLLLLSLAAFGADKKQLPPPAPAKFVTPALSNTFIQKQFGESCTVLPGFAQLVGDLDGDGVDDLMVAARCTNPMADRSEERRVGKECRSR